MSIAPTWLGRVNRPWHRPWPSSAMVNRQASSARASWRCRAFSSWASAISGATTSRTRCASRRSATGSCSLARPIRWVSASRRCSTGSASTPLTITTACSSETCAGGHRVPDRLVVVVQGVRELQAALGVPFGLPGRVGPVAARVGGTGLGAEVEPVGVVGERELELGDLRARSCARAVRGGQVSASRRDQQPRSATSSSRRGSGGDRDVTGCASGSPNTVAIQGILASTTDSSGPGTGAFRAAGDEAFRKYFWSGSMSWSRRKLRQPAGSRDQRRIRRRAAT